MRACLLVVGFVVSGCGLIDKAASRDVDYDVPVVEREDFDGDDALESAVLNITISESSPGVPSITNADQWGPLLEASVLAEAAGMPRLFSISTQVAPTFNAPGPVQFEVTVSSSDGEVWGDELSGTPTLPSECTFIVDPENTQNNELPTNLENCLVAWAETNGVPSSLAISITGQVVATAGLGQVAFSYSNTNVDLETDEIVEMGCSRGIAVSSTVADNIENIDFVDTTLNAEGGSTSGAVVVIWSARVYDSNGVQKAHATNVSAFASGETRNLTIRVQGDDVEVSGTGQADATLLPSTNEWVGATIDALSGQTTGEQGGGRACWVSVGEPGRTGFVNIGLVGVANVGVL